MNINLDFKTLEACIKVINNIGSTSYVNICTKQTHILPWGSGDWLGAVFVAFVLLVIVVVVVRMFLEIL